MRREYLLPLLMVYLLSSLTGCSKMTPEQAGLYFGTPSTSNVQRTPASTTAKKEKGKLELLGAGTGFFITDDGVLVTNFHVIEHGNVVSVFHNKQIIFAEVLKIDPYNDLAILKVPLSTRPVPVVPIFDGARGEDVFTLGYPISNIQGIEQKATFGRINAKSGIQDDIRFLQIDVPVHPGNSGGPLFNDKGEVIGVVSAILNHKATIKTGVLPQNVAYALKADYIWPLLRQAGITSVKTKGKAMNLPALVSKSEQSVVQIFMFQQH